MSISLAGTLTPHLWKGEPTVVIRGRFVMGLVTRGDCVYLAPNLSLASGNTPLATPLVPGASVSVQVIGRSLLSGTDTVGQVYTTPAGFGVGGVHSFGNYAAFYDSAAYPDRRDLVRAMFPAEPYAAADVGMFFAPRVFFSYGMSNRCYNKSAVGEGGARSDIGSVGSLVAPDLRVVLRGALASLDITGITAAGFPEDSTYTLGYMIETTPWFSNYSYSGYAPPGVGWRATDVHIYDNPGLRGHVTAGDVPVIWE